MDKIDIIIRMGKIWGSGGEEKEREERGIRVGREGLRK